MADTFSNILFSADFDPAQYIKGIDEMIASVKKFAEQETHLRKSLSDTESQLKENESAQQAAKKAIDDASTSEKKNADSLKTLNAELAKLKDQNLSLTQALSGQQSALTAIAQKNKEVEASYAKVRTVVADLQKQSGTPIKLAINEGDVINALQTVRGYFKSFSEGIDFSNVTDELKAQILTAKSDIEALTIFIEQANQKLSATDPGSEGYDDLKKAVGSANQMLESYNVLIDATGKEQDNTGKTTVSLRTRIRELRDELTKLEDAGLENTETFKKTQLEAARLTDQYGDMQQRIRILASDTKGLDFGVAALQTAATGYQTVLGAMELFGLSSEASAEAQRKLLAVMNLVQGAQQLQNLLLKTNVLRTVGADIASKAYAATQRVLAVSLGVSAAAARTLSVALLTTGVGALVVGLGFLISKISEWTSTTDDATEAQDALTAAIDRQNKSLAYELDTTDFSTNIRNEKLKQRGAKENEIFENGQKALLEKKAVYDNKINELDRLYNSDKKFRTQQALDQIYKLEDERTKVLQTIELNSEKERTRIAEEGRKKRTAGAKNENVFLKELLRLSEALAKASEKDFTSEEMIGARFRASLEKQLQGIDEFLKNKQLTKPQADKLKSLIRQIIDFDQTKAVEDFRKKLEELNEGINKELQALRFEESESRLANIQNDFARETAAIALELKKQKAELRQKRQDTADELGALFLKGELTQSQFDAYSQEFKEFYDKMLEDLKASAAAKNADLAEKIFQASLNELDATLRNKNIAITEANNKEISDLSAGYLRGEVSYAAYQKRLTEILKAEARKRKEEELKTIDEQITALLVRPATTKLGEAAQKAQIEQLRGLEERKAALEREIATGNADDLNSEENQRIQGIVKYVDAIGVFINQVIGFWQKANEAEQRSIEKSIALQDKRVAAATRVAEKGNATYLKLEEEKQQELLIKQENAARRQMAINAALQASQLLVAVTGAVAKIATPGIGAVDVIASIGVIIGALASGYALVKSLQENQPTFAEGETYVRRDARKNISNLQRKGEPQGKDTIPAWLDEGEAVTDKETNKLYHPVIRAIHDRRIPPEVINGVVNTYHKWSMPQLNIRKMDEATHIHITHDSRVAGLLSENIKETKKLQKIIKGLGVNASLDARGFSLAVTGFQVEHNLNKKT